METFDLDAAIAAIRERRAAEAAAKQEEATQKAQQERERAEQVLMEAMRRCFPIAVQEALEMEVVYNVVWNKPVICFHVDDMLWLLDYYEQQLRQLEPHVSHGYAAFKHSTGASPVLDQLLERVAEWRQNRAERAERIAADERREAAELARIEATLAEREAEHARCLARIGESLTAAQSRLWQWPAAREITIYRWSWCIATGSEDASAEYDSGWSCWDRLDSDGYVHLEEASCSRERSIRLDMLAHKPVVERVVIRSIVNLPAELRQTATMDIPGIRQDSDGYGGPVWYAEDIDFTVSRTVGSEPRPWIRALAEG